VRLAAIGSAAAVGLTQDLATTAVTPTLDIVFTVAGIVLIGALSQRRVLRRLGLPVLLDRGAQTPLERLTVLITIVVGVMVLFTVARYVVEASGAPLRHTLTTVAVVAGSVLGMPTLLRLVLHRLPSPVGRA
jgi:hypothetical protein